MTRVKSKMNLALSREHKKELRREIEQKKKRAHIERELKVMDFDLYQANKGTPMMTIENRRDHPLPAKEKREFSLLANSASLKKKLKEYI